MSSKSSRGTAIVSVDEIHDKCALIGSNFNFPCVISRSLLREIQIKENELIPVNGYCETNFLNKESWVKHSIIGITDQLIKISFRHDPQYPKKEVSTRAFIFKSTFDGIFDIIIGKPLLKSMDTEYLVNNGSKFFKCAKVGEHLIPLERTFASCDQTVLMWQTSFKSRPVPYVRDGNGRVVVHVDGSCFDNGNPKAAAGIGVFWGDGHPLNVSRPAISDTNNVAEIESVIVAVKSAREDDISELCIRTDSEYLSKSIRIWIPKWKRNGWVTANNTAVKNKDIFERLDKLLRDSNELDIVFEHVPAHKGVYGNEMADTMAKAGALMRRKEKQKPECKTV